MVTEAWTLAGCGGAAASKSAVVVQEVPALLHPVAKKPISLRGVAVASSACQDAIVVVGRCCGIASCLLAMLALTGASSFGPLLTFLLKKQNNMTQVLPSSPSLPNFPFLSGGSLASVALSAILVAVQMLQHTVIPERPMFYPEYTPQGTFSLLCSYPLSLSLPVPLKLSPVVVQLHKQEGNQTRQTVIDIL